MKDVNFHLDRPMTLGFVYDDPQKLKNFEFIQFPQNAQAEWESASTIDIIAQTWREIGFEVKHFPVNESFLNQWSTHYKTCDLIHAVVEGFGSRDRESWIPSLSELSGIPYIGSSPFCHSICMSKSVTKMICQQLGIPTPPYYIVHNENDFLSIPSSFWERPHFIKPDAEGSGMGIDADVSVSQSKEKTREHVLFLLKEYPHGILLEEYLSGPEYSVGLLGYPTPTVLPIAQIEVSDGVYGLKHKSKNAFEEKITFPSLPTSCAHVMRAGSLALFQTLKMQDFARLDWKCNDKGEVFFLEANTLAGLSPEYSVFPVMAQEAGIGFTELLKILAQGALKRRRDKNFWYGKSRM